MAEVKFKTRGWIAHEKAGKFPVRPAEVLISGPMPDGMCMLSVRVGEDSQLRACALVPKALMDELRRQAAQIKEPAPEEGVAK